MKIGRNYFINNTIDVKVPVKISDEKTFGEYFGISSFMGKDGEPTKIDFSKEYIIVIDYGDTSKEVKITP